ncbi:MAG: YolD-like family protein [Bacteroidales bacterium]|nr:YolD-like family protein [Bacteroidales bacterium]
MNEYDDIIDHPHYEPKRHPRMSMHNRAAQFAPFAALTGYDAAINETARLTDTQLELEEYDNQRLQDILMRLAAQVAKRPAITVIYFKPDERKAGGAYHTLTGNLKTIDEATHSLVMADGTRIPLGSVLDLEEAN